VEQQRPRGLRGFVQTPVGRTLLLAFGIGVVYGAFVLTVLLAIPAILIAGLLLPIYAGIKRPRYLAISGLVILLLVAPIITATFTDQLLVPIGPASSGAAGVEWGVTIGGTTQVSQSSQIVFELPNGTQNYTVSPVAGFAAPSAGTVTVSGSPVSVPVTYTDVLYPLTFTESNLGVGTSWGITIGSTTITSTTTTLVFNLTNGSYAYRVDGASGYVPPSRTGIVTVDGSAVGLSVDFSLSAYATTFVETGLPTGTPWSVTAMSTTVTSTATTLVLELPNGTDPFTAASVPGFSSPGGQNADVAGTAKSVPVAFAPVTYLVTFSESNLPGGSTWSVEINGELESSTGPSISFNETNGSYPYEVGFPAGYAPVAANGTVEVNGAPDAIPVVFNTATAYLATFTESGLANGTAWGVTIGPTILETTSTSVSFNLSSAKYPFAVSEVPTGYSVKVPSGNNVTVAGAAVSTPVNFSALNYTLTFTETHLPSGTPWNVTVNGVTHGSTSTTVVFRLPNGTYPYRIGSPSGKAPPAVNAVAAVDGSATSVAVPFASTAYSVTFTETGLPSGGGTAVLQNAAVSPFHGDAATEFTWTVTVDPAYFSSMNSSPLWVEVYVSTCPGAITNGSTLCAAGYPFLVLTHFFCTDPTTLATCEATVPTLTAPVTVAFNYTVGEDGIWDWQMGLAVENLASHGPAYTYLVGEPGYYNGLEGPVVGSFATVFELTLPSFYLEDFLFLGLPFYAVLLLYVFFKSRERRREDARRRNAGPIPPSSGAEAGAAPAAAGSPPLATEAQGKAPPGPAVGEQACPNCGAVVYPSELKCWKCGAALSAPKPGNG